MKPTLHEIEIGKEIVNNLIAHDFFDAFIGVDEYEGTDIWGWCRRHKDFLEENHLEVHFGETKACIISDRLPNWVIKTGFIYLLEDKRITSDFCAIEEKNYQSATEEGLDEFFTATYKLCTVIPPKVYLGGEEVTFYIQEKAEPDEEKTSATCTEYTGYEAHEDYDMVMSLFRENKKLNDLFEFLHCYNINDLHSGNFGYTTDGTVKIIDFSGY